MKDVDSHKTASEVLDTSTDGPLRSGSDALGYVIIPRKGAGDFSEVKDYVLTIFKEPYVIKEQARIYLVNASGKTANKKAVEDKLKAMGYNVVGSEDAVKTQTGSSITESSTKPYTTSLLKKRFSASIVRTTRADADIVITFGSSYKLN